jgi:hypothetical protein
VTGGAFWRTTMSAILACACAVAVVGAQQDAFKKGMDARKEKKWAAAAAAMRDAIMVDGKESSKKVNRTFGVGKIAIGGDEYLPYYYLGDALFNLGDCTGALNAWEESDRQGVARRVGASARTIENGYKECEAKGFLPAPKFAREAEAARAAYTAATDVAQRLNDYASARTAAITPEYREQILAARTQLQSANDTLTSGERTRRAQNLSESRTNSDIAVRQYRIARETLDTIVERTAGYARRISVAQDALHAAEATGRDIDVLITSSPVKVVPPDALTADRRRAVGIVASAREKLASASRSQSEADVNDATRLLDEARTLLDNVHGQIDTQIKTAVGRELLALERSGSDAFSSLETRAQAIGTTLGERTHESRVDKDFETIQGTLSTARRTFDRAIRARDLTGARAAALVPVKLAPQLDSLAAALRIGDIPVVPDSLKAAAQALFDGRYAQVLATLPIETADSLDKPLRIHAHVIRAAALFALYTYSGDTNDVLRAQARQEVEACRTLDEAFRPDPDAFAPRFIDFFLTGSGRR